VKAVFLRLLEETEYKSNVLRDAVIAPEQARFEIDPRTLDRVPRSRFAYSVSDRIRALFSEYPLLHGEQAQVWST
jgi:hypothetical protein